MGLEVKRSLHLLTTIPMGIKLPLTATGEVAGRDLNLMFVCLFVFGVTASRWARASSFTRFLDQKRRRITVSRTPLDE